MNERLVWYAAYGSNLLTDRLACYITGGQPPGADGKADPGARDKAPPRDERAIFLPYQLGFAGRSKRWQGGGVCYLVGPRDASRQSLGRAWLLTAQQFEDLVRQENGDDSLSVDADDLEPDQAVQVGSGAYGRVLCVDRFDDIPVLTCTALADDRLVDARAPGAAYLRCVIAGLRETFALNKQGVKKYLKRLPGCTDLDPSFVNKVYDQASDLVAED